MPRLKGSASYDKVNPVGFKRGKRIAIEIFCAVCTSVFANSPTFGALCNWHRNSLTGESLERATSADNLIEFKTKVKSTNLGCLSNHVSPSSIQTLDSCIGNLQKRGGERGELSFDLRSFGITFSPFFQPWPQILTCPFICAHDISSPLYNLLGK